MIFHRNEKIFKRTLKTKKFNDIISSLTVLRE